MRMIECPECFGKGKVPDPATVGQELRKMRLSAGLRLKDLARIIGVTSAYLCDIEKGRRAALANILHHYEKLKSKLN